MRFSRYIEIPILDHFLRNHLGLRLRSGARRRQGTHVNVVPSHRLQPFVADFQPRRQEGPVHLKGLVTHNSWG